MDVSDRTDFEFVIRLKKDLNHSRFWIGVASGVVSTGEHHKIQCGRFLDIDGGFDEILPVSVSDWSLSNHPENCEYQEPQRLGNVHLKKDQTVRMWYAAQPLPMLSYSIAEAPLMPLASQDMEATTFRPCVVFFSDMELDVVGVSSLSRKRKREEQLSELSRKLWEERTFTDAEVRCGGRSFAVHRAVLCARSRVFASLFQGGGLEGGTACVDMTGEDPCAVEGLLQHAYTLRLPGGCDPARLLPLADRYELFDCVEECAAALVERVRERPAEVLRALRPYAEDRRLQYAWGRACAVVLASPALTVAVFRSI